MKKVTSIIFVKDGGSMVFTYDDHLYNFEFHFDQKIDLKKDVGDMSRGRIMNNEEIQSLLDDIKEHDYEFFEKHYNRLKQAYTKPVTNVALYRDGGSADFTFNSDNYKYKFYWDESSLSKNGHNMSLEEINDLIKHLKQSATPESYEMIMPRIISHKEELEKFKDMLSHKVTNLLIESDSISFSIVDKTDDSKNKYQIFAPLTSNSAVLLKNGESLGYDGFLNLKRFFLSLTEEKKSWINHTIYNILIKLEEQEIYG